MGRGRGGPHYGGAQYGHGPPPPDYSAHADSPVVMVYGLEPTKINADRVFNIFCLYGNVERVSWCCFSFHNKCLFLAYCMICEAYFMAYINNSGLFLGEVHEK